MKASTLLLFAACALAGCDLPAAGEAGKSIAVARAEAERAKRGFPPLPPMQVLQNAPLSIERDPFGP